MRCQIWFQLPHDSGFKISLEAYCIYASFKWFLAVEVWCFPVTFLQADKTFDFRIPICQYFGCKIAVIQDLKLVINQTFLTQYTTASISLRNIWPTFIRTWLQYGKLVPFPAYWIFGCLEWKNIDSPELIFWIVDLFRCRIAGGNGVGNISIGRWFFPWNRLGFLPRQMGTRRQQPRGTAAIARR